MNDIEIHICSSCTMNELYTFEEESSFSFTFGEPPEASAGHGEQRRHPRRCGGAVQRQQRFYAEARLDGRPAQRTTQSHSVYTWAWVIQEWPTAGRGSST
jgi:hypothetical protein